MTFRTEGQKDGGRGGGGTEVHFTFQIFAKLDLTLNKPLNVTLCKSLLEGSRTQRRLLSPEWSFVPKVKSSTAVVCVNSFVVLCEMLHQRGALYPL